MSVSGKEEVEEFYDASAEAYAAIMDSEIELPLYADVLARLAERIADQPGSLVDTSCGPGHLLRMYHDEFEPTRELIGVDLSARMVAQAAKKLGPAAEVYCGDMRDMPGISTASVVGVISFFALHHVDRDDAVRAMCQWHRLLAVDGQLLIGTWEGAGPIDYGDAGDIVALRYTKEEVSAFAGQAGFVVDRCVVEPVDEIPMDAVYPEATRPT